MSFLIGMGTGVGVGTITGTQSVSNATNYAVNSIFPNTLIGVNDVIDLVHRNFIKKDLFYEIMKNLGYGTEHAKMLYASQDSLLTPEQATLYRIDQDLKIEYAFENGSITEGQKVTAIAENQNLFFDLMKRNGYRLAEAERSFAANRPLPSFSTILSWLAKEVFEPEAIKTFELDKEQPPELANYMRKYGVPDSEARKYWIEHWNPIGYGQWRTLYNRFNSRRSKAHIDAQLKEYLKPDGSSYTFEDVKIDDDTYRKYFTVLEFPPFIRDRLLAATSEPINFTTLQDLFRYGILNTSQLKEFFRDYNYSDYNASLIVDAWKRKFPYGDRLPNYENIFYQYDKGIISRVEATQQLQTAGVDAETIKFQLDRVSDKRSERRIEYKMKALAMKFGRKVITEAELKAQIALITADVERREYMFLEIEIASEKYLSRPSTRQIGKGYKDGNLTQIETIAALQTYRMEASDILLLLKINDPSQEITQESMNKLGL